MRCGCMKGCVPGLWHGRQWLAIGAFLWWVRVMTHVCGRCVFVFICKKEEAGGLFAGRCGTTSTTRRQPRHAGQAQQRSGCLVAVVEGEEIVRVGGGRLAANPVRLG